MIVTRFAPSPTGYLHLGHAASALFAYEAARRKGGRFLLRIEDIDPVRCREVFVEGILDDLRWLGLQWLEPVWRQSRRLDVYAEALSQLREMGLLYPCFCTRREVAQEAANAAAAPHQTPEEGPVYLGACRFLSKAQREALAEQRQAVWRMDMGRAMGLAGPLRFHDSFRGWVEARPERFGDVVLARKDVATSYHLSVTVDDAAQDVSLVTRGVDLLAFTDLHVLLQRLLNLPTPDYRHHPLLLGADGHRLAKRDKAETIRAMRKKGMSAEEVRALAEKGMGRPFA